jgi:hypothetical protein
MNSGWIVQIEIEAGNGELEPLVCAVALADHRAVTAAALGAPEVADPRSNVGDQAHHSIAVC